MSWIRHLSLSQALAIACAWPATLFILPGLVLSLSKVYSVWVDWRSAGTTTFFMRLRIVQWPMTPIVLLLPPFLFLAVWWFARSRFGDGATC